jgi:hypothetical protein
MEAGGVVKGKGKSNFGWWDFAKRSSECSIQRVETPVLFSFLRVSSGLSD